MLRPSLYLISDRSLFGHDPEAQDILVEFFADGARAGIELIQIREKDLPASALVRLCARARAATSGFETRLLVNDRLDVALAAGIDGVHLASSSIPAHAVRSCVERRLVIGVSTHSDLEVAAATGADFAVCGPVFETPSKRRYGAPLGPERVRSIARSSPIPVLALGGITRENAPAVLSDEVQGIAAIRLFHEAWLEGGFEALGALVAHLRGVRTEGVQS